MMETTCDAKVGKWTVRGNLRTAGIHAGKVSYQFKTTDDGAWLGGGTDVPKNIQAAIAAEKLKIKETLHARWVAKGVAVAAAKGAVAATAMKGKAEAPAMKGKIEAPVTRAAARAAARGKAESPVMKGKDEAAVVQGKAEASAKKGPGKPKTVAVQGKAKVTLKEKVASAKKITKVLKASIKDAKAGPRTRDAKVGKWVVRGILRETGIHAGKVSYRFRTSDDGAWLPGSTEVPKSIEDTIAAEKVKIRKALHEVFHGKAESTPVKAKSKVESTPAKAEGKVEAVMKKRVMKTATVMKARVMKTATVMKATVMKAKVAKRSKVMKVKKVKKVMKVMKKA